MKKSGIKDQDHTSTFSMDTIMTLKWALCLSIIFLCSAGCMDQENHVRNNTVNVGIILPLSGDLMDRGTDCLNGITLAIEEIHAEGGIASLNGATITPIVADTRGDPVTGLKEAERLIIDEGVSALIGAYQSSVNIQATQGAEMHKTPFIINVGIADIITERGFRYTFRVAPKAEFYAATQIQFLSDYQNLTGKKIHRVTTLHENTGFGTAVALDERAALIKEGFMVTGDFAYEAADVTDMTGIIEQVLSTHPDAILETTYLNDSILIRDALDKAGSDVPLVDAAGGTISDEYIRRLGSKADLTFSVAEFSISGKDEDNINTKFRERFGMNISGDSAYSYQAVRLLKDALERASSLDKEKIRDAISQTNMSRGPYMILPDERIVFNSDGQNIFSNLEIIQIQNGSRMVVWPSESATSQVIVAS